MQVKNVTVTEDHVGRRIDNYLVSQSKGLPKSRVYRALRTGEVRVNKSRVSAEYRLKSGDIVRIPPWHLPSPEKPRPVGADLAKKLSERILYETPELVVINKLSGLPVHGGTGISTGLIEAFRQINPEARFLELVHRLDRETSGCLMIAKKRRMLLLLQDKLRQRVVKKQYLALVKGVWKGGPRVADVPLERYVRASGERFVRVSPTGKAALTRFRPVRQFAEMTLLEAQPVTGRTHQIRVHARHLGYPLVGDTKYGDPVFNLAMRRFGCSRLFLHAQSLEIKLPEIDQILSVLAPLDKELEAFLDKLPPLKP